MDDLEIKTDARDASRKANRERDEEFKRLAQELRKDRKKKIDEEWNAKFNRNKG